VGFAGWALAVGGAACMLLAVLGLFVSPAFWLLEGVLVVIVTYIGIVARGSKSESNQR
jgi:hypothetical protein